jgi:hypothetical protein
MITFFDVAVFDVTYFPQKYESLFFNFYKAISEDLSNSKHLRHDIVLNLIFVAYFLLVYVPCLTFISFLFVYSAK